jgi:hypothetical protein
MRAITLSADNGSQPRLTAAVSLSGEEVLWVDASRPFDRDDHFTVFWHGDVHVRDLNQFVSDFSTPPGVGFLASTFYFPDAKIRLPGRRLENFYYLNEDLFSFEDLLSNEYTRLERGKGPRFVRYELYSGDTISDDFRLSRWTVWAGISTSNKRDNRIGLFTTLDEADQLLFQDSFTKLLLNTITPSLNLAEDEARALLGRSLEQLRGIAE